MTCGPATLFRRRVWIVELDANELFRAEVYGRKRNRRHELTPAPTNYAAHRDADGRFNGVGFGFTEAHIIGAQGELAVGKVLEIRVPLELGLNSNRQGIPPPDLPPDWSVKTRLATSKLRDLRIQRRDIGHGYRHVLVERDVALHGEFVFIVHGWISDEHAIEVGRQPFGPHDSTTVALRHLQPLERELYDTTHGAPTDQPPAPAPFDMDEDAG